MDDTFTKKFRIADDPVPPHDAKYRLIFWGWVMFFKTKYAAEHTKCLLPYYQQEDAFIEEIKKA